MQWLRAAGFMVVLAACNAHRVVVPPPAPPVSLDDLASKSLNARLVGLGYRVEIATAAHGRAVIVARDGATWYLASAVETSSAPEGSKVLVRLSVFREPGRMLKGEVAPYAIAPDAPKDTLARMLGERAANQFDENFHAHE
jgi:hypothetical protein